jgi:hypothetical protein
MFSDFGNEARAREASRVTLQQQQRAMLDAQVAERLASGITPATGTKAGRRSFVSRDGYVPRTEDAGEFYDRFSIQPARPAPTAYHSGPAGPPPASYSSYGHMDAMSRGVAPPTNAISGMSAAARHSPLPADWSLPTINVHAPAGTPAAHSYGMASGVGFIPPSGFEYPGMEMSPGQSPSKTSYGRARSDITRGVTDDEVARRVAKQEQLAADLEAQVREKESRKAAERKRQWEEDQVDLRRMGITPTVPHGGRARFSPMAPQPVVVPTAPEVVASYGDAPSYPVSHGMVPRQHAMYAEESLASQAIASGDPEQMVDALSLLERRLDTIVAALPPTPAEQQAADMERAAAWARPGSTPLRAVASSLPSPSSQGNDAAIQELSALVRAMLEEQKQLKSALASQSSKMGEAGLARALVTPAQGIRKRGASSAPVVRRQTGGPHEEFDEPRGMAARANSYRRGSHLGVQDRDGGDSITDRGERGEQPPPRGGAASARKPKAAFGRTDEGKETAAARRARGEARLRGEAEKRKLTTESSKITRHSQKEALRNQLADELSDNPSGELQLPFFKRGSAAAAVGAGRIAVSPINGSPERSAGPSRRYGEDPSSGPSSNGFGGRAGGGYRAAGGQPSPGFRSFEQDDMGPELGGSSELQTESHMIPLRGPDSGSPAFTDGRSGRQRGGFGAPSEHPSGIPIPVRVASRRAQPRPEDDAPPAPGGRWGAPLSSAGQYAAAGTPTRQQGGSGGPNGSIYSLLNK